MAYRGMTEEEIAAFVHEFRAFQLWREFVSYARDIYGAAAERVEVTTAAERNVGCSYLVIDLIGVYDARRRPLEPDFTTAWWQAMFRECFPDDELCDEDAHEDWIEAMIGERRAGLVVPAGGFDVFLASRPPRRRFTALFVDELPALSAVPPFARCAQPARA
ncbi:hypothetical protein [Kouleothrix sp.]|uniref:hypothetical protein n=1 Tax=Kouleothrix sp. TaxID=2779161 RepID=UPI003919AB43